MLSEIEKSGEEDKRREKGKGPLTKVGGELVGISLKRLRLKSKRVQRRGGDGEGSVTKNLLSSSQNKIRESKSLSFPPSKREKQKTKDLKTRAQTGKIKGR